MRTANMAHQLWRRLDSSSLDNFVHCSNKLNRKKQQHPNKILLALFKDCAKRHVNQKYLIQLLRET